MIRIWTWQKHGTMAPGYPDGQAQVPAASTTWAPMGQPYPKPAHPGGALPNLRRTWSMSLQTCFFKSTNSGELLLLRIYDGW